MVEFLLLFVFIKSFQKNEPGTKTEVDGGGGMLVEGKGNPVGAGEPVQCPADCPRPPSPSSVPGRADTRVSTPSWCCCSDNGPLVSR